MAGPRSRTNRNRWLAGAAWLGLSIDPLAGAAESRAAHPPALPADFLAAPLVRQAQSYSCGPAALASVLRYFRVWSGPETALYQPLAATPTDGTLPEKLAEVALRFGLQSRLRQPMTIAALREALRERQLVILELQAWPPPGAPPVAWSDRWNDGHYVVLIAMDDQYAYFMDPSTRDRYTYLELDELGPRWHDINPVRPAPLAHHDFQLGVVIGRPATRRLVAEPAAPRGKLRPLVKLE